MAGFALGQLGASPEDDYAGAEAWVEPTATGSATGSILDTIMASGSDLLQAITQGDVVKATLNKYVFGKTAPIPTATNVARTGPVPVSAQIIPGIPNTYLLIGGAVALFLFMKKR